MSDVTIAIPVYNEGAALVDNLAATFSYLEKHGRRYAFDYIIVDDGSTDGSYEHIQNFAREHDNVSVIHFEENKGLGYALRAALDFSRSPFVVTLDADLSYGPDVAIALLDAIQTQAADIAMASPYMPGGSVANVPWSRKILSREANRFLSLATNGRYATLTCMVRAYRRSALAGIEFGGGMEVNSEVVFAALRKGARVVEVPARLEWSAARAAGASRLRWARLGTHVAGVLRCGLRFRPALCLAIPGLVPGLLPAVVAGLLIAHVSRQVLAIGTAATIVVQYLSLAIFAGQATSFFGTRFFTRRRQSVGCSTLEERYRALHT